MRDIRSTIEVSYVIIMALVSLMAIDYIGVVSPEFLGKNFIMDMLAPLAFQNATPIRYLFIVGSIILFFVNPVSDMVGDAIARQQSRKFAIAVAFLFATVALLRVDKLGYELFAIIYPIVFLVFNLTGFILANLLKRKEILLDSKFGFERVNVLVENPTSFNWRSVKDGYINIEAVFRGILILSSAGGGKTYTLIEPLLEQAILKGFTGLVYDFKMAANFSENSAEWSLSRYVYMCFLKHRIYHAKKDSTGKWIGESSLKNDRRKLWFINFRDPRYSHRINAINPVYMLSQSFANECSLTLLQNLKPEWIKQRDFFADSAIIYLKAVFWFLRCQFPESCNVPIAVTIALMGHSKVLAMLSLDKQCTEIISSLLVAEAKNAEGQLAGAVASLQVPIDRLNSPEIFWVLSDSDFSLQLNDPNAPGILCLGNDPELKDTYSPVSALIATVVKKVLNKPGMSPSLFVLDEAPTLALPALYELPATARSNRLCAVVCGQDKSLFTVTYGREATEALFSNLGSHFYGQLNDLDTAKMASEIIGTREKENRSINAGKTLGDNLSKNKGETIGIQRENLIHPYEFLTLPQGRFVGKVAQVSEKTPYSPFFNVRPDINRPNVMHKFPQLLRSANTKELTIEEMNELMAKNYEAIKKEAYRIVDHCARAACLAGKADETKVYPQHFYKTRRIVSTLGEPMVPGIQVDLETGIVSGTPIFDDTPPERPS